MSETICFDKTLFISAVILLLVFTLVYTLTKDDKVKTNLKNKKRRTSLKPKITSPSKSNDSTQVTVEEVSIIPAHNVKSIEDRDIQAVVDPLYPPTRRLPRHLYPDSPMNVITEIPTRGYPDTYQYLGNLARSSDEKIVKLFGRQTYPGSNRYEYYGITTDSQGMETKVKIDNPRNKEIYDKDEVSVPLFGDNGTFVLYEHDFDKPKYYPHLFY